VIDRDPEVVSALAALLMPQLDVQSALSPLSAAMLLDQLEHVDLAFVELELPDFAGEQLLQQLGRWPDAIRVLLTQSSVPKGAASDLLRNAYLAHLVLSKPISVQVVRALQRATLGLLRI
jgi:CheY-like chemotaxis protein